MKHKILISIIAFLVLAIGVVAAFLSQRGFFQTADADHPTQFIQHDFIDLTKIGSISKFRSGEGHDFSSGGETCRSMKHYFTPAYTAADMKILDAQPLTEGRRLPPAPTPDTAVAIYSPVDGQIVDVQSEHFPVGQQIFIVPDSAKGYVIRIFHVYLVDGVGKNSHVTAGQHIGDISRLSSTDISVEAGRLNGTFISYFDVLPDTIFSAYQALGITQRSDLIFSKDFRDAHPFSCNGEEFTSPHEGGDQELTVNGWTMPQVQSSSGTSGNVRDVTVKLFDDATSNELAGQHVTVASGDGRMFEGDTTVNGTFVLPASSVAQQMTLRITGYQDTVLPYEQALSGNLTVRVHRQ